MAETPSIALWREAKDPKVAAVVTNLEQGLKRAPTVKEVLGLQKRRAQSCPLPHSMRGFTICAILSPALAPAAACRSR